MKKLPNETLDNAINVYKTCIENAVEYDDDCEYNPILDSATVNFLEELKAYRKTGLTPEQIFAMDEECKKLAKEVGDHKKLEVEMR
jgi:hypothetical protein